jgi:molybdopterin-guanine dinucleotide biosynthesis protein A
MHFFGLKALTSRRLRVNDLIADLHASIITVPPALSGCLRNINTPEELHEITRGWLHPMKE